MSLADKLNYTIDAKLGVQNACIYKGVQLPADAPFGTYEKYIKLLPTPHGFDNSYTYTLIADTDTLWCFYISILLLINGVRSFKVYFDNTYIGDIDASNISTSLNSYQTFALSYDESIKAGTHEIKIVLADSATNAYVVEVNASFPIEKYCQTTDGMTNISYSNDDGSNSFACPESYQFYYYNGSLITTIYYSGNTWIGLNSGSEHIKYNRRDTYVSTFYHQLVDLVALKAIKMHWVGWAPYNRRSDPYKYEWEVFLFSNGDGMIVWCSKGSSAFWDGSFSFLGASYTSPTKELPYVSFYRQNELGTSWEVDYEKYSPGKSKNIF